MHACASPCAITVTRADRGPCEPSLVLPQPPVRRGAALGCGSTGLGAINACWRPGAAGTWELVYTNAANILALLAVGDLPLSPVKIGALTQAIDAASHTVVNKVGRGCPPSWALM